MARISGSTALPDPFTSCSGVEEQLGVCSDMFGTLEKVYVLEPGAESEQGRPLKSMCWWNHHRWCDRFLAFVGPSSTGSGASRVAPVATLLVTHNDETALKELAAVSQVSGRIGTRCPKEKGFLKFSPTRLRR